MKYEKVFADLVHDLNGEPLAPASAPPLPTLLSSRGAGIGRPELQKDNDQGTD